MHGAPPEEAHEMALYDDFDDHDYLRKGLGTPRRPDTAPRAYSPKATDGAASTSPGASDAVNVARSTHSIHSPPDPSRCF